MSATLPALPSYDQVRPVYVRLVELHQLYGFYFFGQKLPTDFPQSIINEFPSKAYKIQLKSAIASSQNEWNTLEGIQNKYLTDYYALYGHYFFSQKLPADFPESIIKQFPNDSYKRQLKAAISGLTDEINREKAAVTA